MPTDALVAGHCRSRRSGPWDSSRPARSAERGAASGSRRGPSDGFALNPRYFLATSSVACWRMSLELAPTMMSNLPGSTTRFMSRS